MSGKFYSVTELKLLAEENKATDLIIDGIAVSITKNMVRRYAERDIGEIYEPFEVLPKVTTKLKDKVLIFSNDMPQKVVVEVRAGANNVAGTIKLEVPEGWKVSTKAKTFIIKQKGDTYEVDFSKLEFRSDSIKNGKGLELNPQIDNLCGGLLKKLDKEFKNQNYFFTL